MDLTGIEEEQAWSATGPLPADPPQWHDVTIERADESTSSGGHPQIELEIGNEFGSARDWIVVIPATLGKVKQLLEAASIPNPEDWSNFNPGVLVGKTVRVFMKMEQSRKDPSKSYPTPQGYKKPEGPLPGPAQNAADASDVSFDAAGMDDDDIPF